MKYKTKSRSASVRISNRTGMTAKRRAARLADIGRFKDAMALYRRSARARWRDSYVLYDLAIVLDDLGRNDQALRAAQRARLLNPFDAEIAYEVGFLCYRSGFEEEAKRFYRKAARLSPRFSPALNNLGLIFLSQHSYAAAEQAFRDALRVRRAHIGTALNLIIAKLGQGMDPRAAVLLESSEQWTRRPTPPGESRDRQIIKATLCLISGKEAQARTMFAQLLPKTERDLWGVLSAAEALSASRQQQRAENLWSCALSMQPHLPDAWYGMARIYRERGDLHSAESACNRALEAGGDTVEGLFILAGILRDREQFNDAAAKYLEILRMEPTNLAAINNLGLCEVEAGRAAEAEDTLRTGLMHAPNDPVLLRNLALAVGEQARLDEAASLYLKAARIGPTTGEQWISVAELLEEVGRESEALAARLAADTIAMSRPMP